MPSSDEYRGTGIFKHYWWKYRLVQFWGSLAICITLKHVQTLLSRGPLAGIYPVEIVAHRRIGLSTA